MSRFLAALSLSFLLSVAFFAKPALAYAPYVAMDLYTDPSRCPACAELDRRISRREIDLDGVTVNRYGYGSPAGYIPTAVIKVVRNSGAEQIGQPIVGVEPAEINRRLQMAKRQR